MNETSDNLELVNAVEETKKKIARRLKRINQNTSTSNHLNKKAINKKARGRIK